MCRDSSDSGLLLRCHVVLVAMQAEERKLLTASGSTLTHDSTLMNC